MNRFNDAFETTAGIAAALGISLVVANAAPILWENYAEFIRLRAENPDAFDEKFLSRIRHLPYGDEQGEAELENIFLKPHEVARIKEKWLAEWRRKLPSFNSTNRTTLMRRRVRRNPSSHESTVRLFTALLRVA